MKLQNHTGECTPDVDSKGIDAGICIESLETLEKRRFFNTVTQFDDVSTSSCSKRKRRSSRKGDDFEVADIAENDYEPISYDIDDKVIDVKVPEYIEAVIAGSIFQLGLKYSSPKVIISLMPKFESLTTEHVKSHLQKYRIHSTRSTIEFCSFYNDIIHDQYHQFLLSACIKNDRNAIHDNSGNVGHVMNSYKSGNDHNYVSKQLQGNRALERVDDQKSCNSSNNSGSCHADDGVKNAFAMIKKIEAESDELIAEWATVYQEMPVFKPN